MTLLSNVLVRLGQTPRRLPCLLVLILLLLGLAVTAGPAFAERHFVDQAVAGGNGNGSDWPNAFEHLQDALDVAIAGDEVWVAAGTYVPTLRTDPTDARSATFALVDGVAIFGGFSGGETTLEQRNSDPSTNGCVLDGFDGASNVYHVVTAELVGSGTLLDGFTVTNGLADGGSAETRRGAGISNFDGALTLRNLLVTGNRTNHGGKGTGLSTVLGNVTVQDSFFVGNTVGEGAIFADDLGMLSISRTVFFGNSTSLSGGGLHARGPVEVSIADSTFVENFGSGRAGGILARSQARVRLDRVTFYGNVTNGAGAAVVASESASIVAVNSLFVGNTARATDGNGGAVQVVDNATAVLTSCTVAENLADQNGGGIAVFDSAQVTVQSSVLYGNADGLNGPPPGGGNTSAQQLFVDPASSAAATVAFSVVEGGFAGPNLSDDPLFVRTPDPGDGDWNSPADNDFGDLRLKAGSPAIDAGDNTADLDAGGPADETIADVPTDLAGGLRRLDDPNSPDTGIGTVPIVDIGAYERELPIFADGFESGDTSAWSSVVSGQ